MKKTVLSLSAVFAFFLFLAVAAASHAEPVRANIGDILKSPGSFEGKSIQVEGIVRGLRERLQSNGMPYTTFRLLDRSGNFVNVMSAGAPKVEEGDLADVTGVFQKVRYSSGIPVYNEIQSTEQTVARIEGQR